MPLDDPLRSEFITYIMRHIVPKGVSPRPRTAMEWFHGLLDFIADSSLRKHVAESCYQARFIGRFQEALRLRGDFNRAFLKQQIFLYASIYEAIIDHVLEGRTADPRVASVLTVAEFKPIDALAGKTSMQLQVGQNTYDVVTCRRAMRTRKLQEVRFAERLGLAVKLGLMPRSHQEFVQSLYDARNNIHIMRASETDFAPDARMSSKAFRTLLNFFRHAKRWTSRTRSSPSA